MLNLINITLTTVFALLLLSSCDTAQNSPSTHVYFKPMFNNKILNCYSPFMHSNQQWHYTQLQFFISGIQAKNYANVWQNLPLKTSAFQSNNSVLLGERCQDATAQGNLQTKTHKPNNANWQIFFTENTNLNNYTHIRFTLGLPFEVNHLNPLIQDSPLNIPSMFWSWQGGHKFLRLELMSASDNWLFHLGSVGCAAASPMRAPLQECLQPNRYSYELALNKNNPMITFELAELLNNLTVSEQTSCQSSPESIACQTLFENLKAINNDGVFRLKKAAEHE